MDRLLTTSKKLDTEIVLIDKLDDKLYLEIYPLLKKGEERLFDGNTIADLINDIKFNVKQLWVIKNNNKILSIVITSIIQYPKVKRLLYYLMSGKDFEACYRHHKTVENWAKEAGCEEVELFGRAGWIRKLNKHGFQPEYTLLTKKIKD